MAAGLVKIQDTASREEGYSNKLYTATVYSAGALSGSSEHIVGLPTSAGGWQLTRVSLAAGVNTTHSTAASITATVEKNTDGGTAALSTNPSITDAAGTGREVIDSNDSSGTGLTPAVIDTDNDDFVDSDVVFVTITEAGSGGSDPEDISVTLDFTELQDFDPNPTS